MLRWILTTTCALLLASPPQDKPAGQTPPDTQPAAEPAPARGGQRRPAQAEILKRLIEEQRRRAPIVPVNPGDAGAPDGRPTTDAEGNPLLLDGAILVERPGRLVHEDGAPKLILHPDGSSRRPRSLEVLKNQWLEVMEREAAAGNAEFLVTAEVTQYKGENCLLVRKLLRRVDDGNLSP